MFHSLGREHIEHIVELQLGVAQQRLIRREAVDRIAKAVLEGRFTKGEVVKIDVKDDALCIGPGPNREATQPRATG